jgi:drug/metabolite transporter (DMT)-like permease
MRGLHDTFGFSALTLAFLRAGISFTIVFLILLFVRRDLLRLTRQSLVRLGLYGLIGIAIFYFVYAQAIITTTVTTAVVLLYTAPAFVALMAWRAWGESLDTRKLIAIGLAFAGCALVARAYDPSQLSLNWLGIVFGLGAGFTYALFTVFSKAGMRQFSTWTLMTYELLFGALFLLPLQNMNELAILGKQPAAWLLLLGLAFGPTLGAITSFNLGLRDLPASNASILATLEPVVASVLAFIMLGERLEPLQILGGGMVIAGAVWLSAGNRL